jgi:hypothetical protein
MRSPFSTRIRHLYRDRLQLNESNDQLTVVLNRLPTSDDDVDYSDLAEKIILALRDASFPHIRTVRFYGRKQGAKQTEWKSSYEFALSHSHALETADKSPKEDVSKESDLQKNNIRKFLHGFNLFQDSIMMVTLIGILGILLANTLIGNKPKTVAWEYQIESVPDLLFDTTMNELGNEGWELVFARRANDSITDDFSYECIFKRKK